MKLAIVRGKFLNRYEMQSFVSLIKKYDITAFGSLYPYHDTFPFPVKRLLSPMDLPEFPWGMPILNRLCVDAHYLVGLEKALIGFDIVHTAETYYHYTQQALNAKNKGYVKKVVATVLENIPFNNEGIWGRKVFKKRSRVDLDHMIALTNLTKQALCKEGADPKKITVIGHGIDTKTFQPEPDHWEKLSNSKKDVFTILFSGRLEAYKGVFDILEAGAILVNDSSIKTRLRFLFVGQGSSYSSMRQIGKISGINRNVSYLSVPYDRMPAVYEKADLFVAPSISTKTWSEQYSTVLLEAQSMGLPIVTTKCGGIPENVGCAALFAKEGDPGSLARQMKRFILNAKLRSMYGKKARDRAVRVHDVSIIAKKLDRVYQSLGI